MLAPLIAAPPSTSHSTSKMRARPDPRSALVTKGNSQETYTTCSQLAELGYLPKGVQAFQAPQLTGELLN